MKIIIKLELLVFTMSKFSSSHSPFAASTLNLNSLTFLQARKKPNIDITKPIKIYLILKDFIFIKIASNNPKYAMVEVVNITIIIIKSDCHLLK